MKKVILCTLLLCCTYHFVHAQKEMNWWYFGSNAGLNFSQLQEVNGVVDMPTPITGPISTWEGCFSISDSDGNFILASDGSIVYNKAGTTMTNGTGLLGNNSAAQSGIVIPVPESPGMYYIVTVDYGSGTKGLNYSIVDLSKQGGLGEVTSTKNVSLLAGSVDENIASVRHKNNKDYWLIHQQGKNFYVWLLTKTEVSSPQIYNFPIITPCGTSGESIASKLTFSPDNTKFACCYYLCNAVCTGGFDRETGVISDVKYRTGLSWAYGAEFSASGEYIYIGSLDYNTYKGKYETLRDGGAMTPMGIRADNFQIGPDKRIYGVERSTRNLFVIMDPDDGGTDTKTFSNYLLANAGIGLPTFMASWLSMVVEGENSFCINTEQSFTLTISGDGGQDQLSYTIWDFGDYEPDCIITDTNISTNTQTHNYTYKKPGTYTISVKSFDENDNLLQEQSIEVIVSRCIIPVNPNIHIYQ
ncbi:MAG: PKD domain-containing protein [Prevotella sp.]|nr:PKD domain-containing protein [Prevotella sp.]